MFLLSGVAIAVTGPVWAQTPDALPPEDIAPVSGYDDEDDGDYDDEDEIVVQAQRTGLSPVTTDTSDVTFNAGDIQALGVTDMNELLEAIAAETGSDSDAPPILLLDGRPVANKREIQKFPSEAVRKIDILPPEAALRYSADPDRRVINFVLRRRFNAVTHEIDAGTTTAGGRDTYEAGSNLLRIKNKTRIAGNISFKSQAPIRQADRDIEDRNAGRLFAVEGNLSGQNGGEIDPALSDIAGEIVTTAGLPASAQTGAFGVNDIGDLAGNPYVGDQRQFRDLRGDDKILSMGASLFRPVGDHLSVSAGVNADLSQSKSLRGVKNVDFDIDAGNPFSPFANNVTLFRADGPLVRDSEKRDIDANLSLFGDYARVRWQLEGKYSHVDDSRETDRSLDAPAIDAIQARIDDNDPDLNPFSLFPVTAKSVSDRTADSFALKSRINARIFTLPAGPVMASGGLEYAKTTLDSAVSFAGAGSANSLSRGSSQARAQVDIPLTGTGQSRAAGRTRLRLSGSLDNVDNFGNLVSYGAGLNWNVTPKLELQTSTDVRKRAPSLTQIGDPVLVDPNIRVTDFNTGEAVFVDRLTGGNPDLKAETRRDVQITAKYRPSRALQITSRYRARRTDDDITSFPFLTPQVAQAFPDRLSRDALGNLTALDARPVNAYRSQVDSLRSGFNWSKRIERKTPDSDRTEAQTPSPAPTGRRRRGPSDRISVSIYHTWRLTEDFQFRETGPVFDLLDGSALRRQGGEAGHEIQGRFSFKRKNYGGRLSVNHETGSYIDTDSLGASQARGGNINFDPLTTADLRLYYDLGRTPGGRPVSQDSWKSGLRISFDANNITDDKQRIRNDAGIVPFGYEPDTLDPEGRSVMLSLRKIFMTRPDRSEARRRRRNRGS